MANANLIENLNFKVEMDILKFKVEKVSLLLLPTLEVQDTHQVHSFTQGEPLCLLQLSIVKFGHQTGVAEAKGRKRKTSMLRTASHCPVPPWKRTHVLDTLLTHGDFSRVPGESEISCSA